MMCPPPESTFNCSNVYRSDGTSDRLLATSQLPTAKSTVVQRSSEVTELKCQCTAPIVDWKAPEFWRNNALFHLCKEVEVRVAQSLWGCVDRPVEGSPISRVHERSRVTFQIPSPDPHQVNDL